MGATRLLRVLAILSLAALAPSRARGDFAYVAGNLGTLQGGNDSTGRSINGGGQVAGWSDVASGDVHAFRGGGGGMLTDLGSSNQQSFGYAINDGGAVAGSYRFLVGQTSTTHAFVSAPGSGLVDLGTLGGNFSEGLGINGAGRVVGRSLNAAGVMRAFATGGPGGGLQDLGTFPGGADAEAHAINDLGEIAGFSSTAFNTAHAFKVLADGTIVDLGTLLGGRNSYGYGINASGQVVGAADDATQSRLIAFRSNGGAFLQPLGTLAGGSASEAFGINDAGLIVGHSLVGGSYRAFLWSQANGMIDLNSLIDPSSGWLLNSAFGINRNGDIAGVGTINGARRAFLLTPPSVPAPPALALLAVGGCGMLAARRKAVKSG